MWPPIPLRRAALWVLMLAVAGCSMTRLAYDQLDVILRWKLSDYVDFTPAQRTAFDAEFRSLWDWHRRTQLPLYAAQLRGLADAVPRGPVSRQQLDAEAARTESRWNALVDRAVPGAARLLGGLSQPQVDQMLARLREEVERRARKRGKESAADFQQRIGRDMKRGLRHWLGSSSRDQEALIERWAAQLPPPAPQLEVEQREALERYARLLATRGQAGFAERLHAYLDSLGDSDWNRSLTAERGRWLQLLADLSATLTADQRRHLRQRLLDVAGDFEALARERPETVR
jgi:hypothetical protein